MFVLFMILGNELAASADDLRASTEYSKRRAEAEKMTARYVDEYVETLFDLDKYRHLSATVDDLSPEDALKSIPNRKVNYDEITEKLLMPSGGVDAAKISAFDRALDLRASLIADYKKLYDAKLRAAKRKRFYLEALGSDRYVEPTFPSDMDPNVREDATEQSRADFRELHFDLIKDAFDSQRRLKAAIAPWLASVTEKEAQLSILGGAVESKDS